MGDAMSEEQELPTQQQQVQQKQSDGNAMALGLPTRIRVVVRVRPKLTSEASHGTNILTVHQQRNLVLCGGSAAKSFQFDQVFDGTTPQRTFYQQLGVDRMLRAVLDGYHATIFAYGQTGSGKTFTMEGYDYEKSRDPSAATGSTRGAMPHARFDTSTNSDRIGLIPRTIFTLFELLALATRDSPREFTIKCSFLQIYNEQILDLFNPSHFLQPRKTTAHGSAVGAGARGAAAVSKKGGVQGLRLRWSSVRDFYVENLRVLECTSPDHVLQHFQDGIKHKIMASHNLNAASSRSHCVFTVYVESYDPTGNPNDVLQSKLALVDLAGSERVDKTGATGVTLQESIGINKSLFVLRQVIQALSEESLSKAKSTQNTQGTLQQRSYIPYRDSKLTSLLKYSLGGNSWTLMIACLSPSDAFVEENMSTLVYAAKAQSITNTPTKNEDPKTVLINELKSEVESLRRQLAQAQEIILQFQQQQPGASSSTGEEEGGAGSSSSETMNPATVSTKPEGAPVSTTTKQTAATPQPLVSETEPNSTTTRASVTLKKNVIDNVEMIKQLYTTEKQLQSQVEKHQEHVEDLQHETRVLHVENQSLREKMEVLEYLLATQDPHSNSQLDEQLGDSSVQDVDEIPGYGSLSSGSLPVMLPVSADRIRDALRRPGGPAAQEAKKPHAPKPPRIRQPLNNQDDQSVESVRSRLQGDAPRRKHTKRKEGDAGLLSLSELRDLLGGKKMTSSSATPAFLSRGSVVRESRPSTNPPPEKLHATNELTPTASILSTLHQHRVETGRSAMERDPLESLSELNRLLRVKATLRRCSSFK